MGSKIVAPIGKDTDLENNERRSPRIAGEFVSDTSRWDVHGRDKKKVPVAKLEPRETEQRARDGKSEEEDSRKDASPPETASEEGKETPEIDMGSTETPREEEEERADEKKAPSGKLVISPSKTVRQEDATPEIDMGSTETPGEEDEEAKKEAAMKEKDAKIQKKEAECNGIQESIEEDEKEFSEVKARLEAKRRALKKAADELRVLKQPKVKKELLGAWRDSKWIASGAVTPGAAQSVSEWDRRKRLRAEAKEEALSSLLNRQKAVAMTISAVLPRGPLGETRRKLEDLGAFRGDIAHLDDRQGEYWLSGNAKGISRILDTLKKAGVQAMEHREIPADWAEALRTRMNAADLHPKKKELLESALQRCASTGGNR